MLLPDALAAMRLGLHRAWTPPQPQARLPVAPPLPAWSREVGAPRVAGNNARIGDCVETGCYNAVQDALANANPPVLVALQDGLVEALYAQLTGWTAANPATDRGTDPEAMFAWWMAHDIVGYRLASATPIDPTDLTAIRAVIRERGGVAVVLNLATENQNQRVLMPDGAPGSWGKHFVWLDGYVGRIISGTSWGEPFYLDQSYFSPGFVLAAYELVLKDLDQ